MAKAIERVLEDWFGEPIEHMEEPARIRKFLLEPLIKAAIPPQAQAGETYSGQTATNLGATIEVVGTVSGVAQGSQEPDFKWGVDYGKDLLADLNQLAHASGTTALLRDGLQRAYKEIARLRKDVAQGVGDCGVTDEQLAISGLNKDWNAARKTAIDDCAKIAEAWEKPSFALMRAGEMTAQELRTVIAVASNIATNIRALSLPSTVLSTPSWPDGCRDANSCARHKACMYMNCFYNGRSIAGDVERLTSEHSSTEGK